MKDQPDTPRILEEISRNTQAGSEDPGSRKRRVGRRRVLILFLLYLPMMGGLLVLGYRVWLLETRSALVAEENRQLVATVAAQAATLEALQAAADDSALPELERALNGELAALHSELGELRREREAGTVAPDFNWKILEADYLLAIASRKLQQEDDVHSALALMEEADAALVASGNNNVFPVRQAIAAEATALRRTEALDRDQVYLRLAGLAGEVDGIDLLASMRASFENRRSAATTSPAPGTAGGFGDSLLAFLGSVFVWRQWEQGPEDVLAPGQDRQFKQSLRLLLEQAQLALLQRDAALFGHSLEAAREWLLRYRVAESEPGRGMLSELDALRLLDIDPPLPALDQSLAAIAQLKAATTAAP